MTATDIAGNASAVTTLSLTIDDTTPPLTPAITAVGGDTAAPYATTDTTPTITGTGEVGAIITIKDGSGNTI